MKKFIVLALMVLMISSFASADLTIDLEVYYSFDDADNTGSDPDDLSGNGYDGVNNDVKNEDWRLGTFRFDVQQDGKR